eukprot:CAMPEP_0113462528 /NCGR_PEP_ID=MMETSP0014_2-20120614/12146_1 /TAXON_ID=2857 /ORGANISM="Nitzschia sp." /LENGTH=955 /DNA_ID=CAMNT_0000354409 /DNA_START=659 /DNA_END=3526 /DNA_ORIENTATION=+ /assembly_acc=CAM_ASM_000159
MANAISTTATEVATQSPPAAAAPTTMDDDDENFLPLSNETLVGFASSRHQYATIYNDDDDDDDEPTPFQNNNSNNNNNNNGGGSGNISYFYDIDSMIPDLFGMMDDDIVVAQNQGQSHDSTTAFPPPSQSVHPTTAGAPAKVQGLQNNTNNGGLPFKESPQAQQQAQPQAQPQSSAFPGTQSTTTTEVASPQAVQNYPRLQYNPPQQQQQQQLVSSQQNIFQLLTMLNQLAAVSTTPQSFQHILQSLGLPHAVLMAAATSLAQVTTTTNGISQQQPPQPQLQQQMPFVSLQQLQQLQNLTLAQTQLHLQQQQQQPQHLPGQNQNCCNQGGRNALFKSNSYVQKEPQNNNSNFSTQHVNTTVSNDTAAAAATTTKPFLNDPTSQIVNMTTSQKSAEIDAMNKKTTTPSVGSVVNGRNSSVANEHIKDSKILHNVDGSNPYPVRMNVQTVQRTTLQNQSRPTSVGATSSSSRPSNFVSPPLDNESGMISSAHIIDHRKKGEPQIVNNKTATMTSNTTTTTTTIPISCPSYDHQRTKPAKHSKGQSSNLSTPSGTADEQQDKATSKELDTTKKIPTFTIILPCRARGMPPDHNFKNAHFIIPPDVKHGQELVCSHAVCRQRGIKFRYCWECRIPVAKRNFHQRHSHGLEDGTFTLGRAVDVRSSVTRDTETHEVTSLYLNEKCTKGMDATKAEENKSIRANKERTTDKDAIQAAINRHSFHRTSGTNESTGEIHQPPIPSSITASESSSCPKRVGGNLIAAKGRSLADVGTDDMYSSLQKVQWATLLDKRPSEDDTDGMSAWLLEVMEVSDSKTHATQGNRFGEGARLSDATSEDATNDSIPLPHRNILVDAEDGSTESEGVSSMDQDLSEHKFQAGNPFTESTEQKHNQVSGSQSSVDLCSAYDSTSCRGTRGLKRKLPSSIEVSSNSACQPHLSFRSAEEDFDDKTEGSGISSDEA